VSIALYGPCAKRVVVAVLVDLSGNLHSGYNRCSRPQQQCPRKPGEGYSKCKIICGQDHHAEVNAIMSAGPHAYDACMIIHGHDHACPECLDLLSECRIRVLFIS
jgi:deoxycytidylate deaminase